MGDQPGWYLLAIVATVLWTAWAAGQRLWRTGGQRRDHRQITETGLPVAGEVTEVSALDRAGNRAAGHPVTVAFTDHTGFRRHLRDDTGLSGYLVRVGQPVTVRYTPDDPAVARIEEIVGRHGRYPVREGGRSAAPPLAPAVLALVGAVAVGPLLFFDVFEELNPLNVVPPVFGLVGLVLLAVGIASLRRQRTRPEQRAEATGVVTDVWSERIRSRRSSSTVYPYTVHFATHDGREVHARTRVASGFRPQPGQHVRVHYDREFPPRFDVSEQRTAALLAAVVPILLGVVFTGVGVVWLVARLTLF